MSEPIEIAALERKLIECAKDFADDPELACPACTELAPLLRLARAADRYRWMLSADGPFEVDHEVVAEWTAALSAFDFGAQETA